MPDETCSSNACCTLKKIISVFQHIR